MRKNRASPSREIFAIAALALFVVLGLAGCDSPSQSSNQSTPPAQTTADTPSTTNTTTTPSEPAAPSEPAVTQPPREEMKLEVAYIRPGVQANQHYVKVEQTLAGPTPCNQESLMMVLQNAGLALQWQEGDRLEIYGAYEQEGGTCRIVLDQPAHTLKALPRPEPTTPAEPVEPTPQPVRLQGTLSALRDGVAYFIVDRLLEGQLSCVQVTLVVAEDSNLTVQGQYEIQATYNPSDLTCQLQLVSPTALRVLSLPIPVIPPVTPTTPPSPSTPSMPSPAGPGFFVSGGVSFVDPLPIFSGSAGMRLADTLRGMVTVGMGSGQIEVKLPSGEPVQAKVNATLIDVAGLMQINGPFYAGLSGGMLLLSGEYDLPFPVNGSPSFNSSIPLVGIVVGYDLGMVLATLSIGIALGG